MSAGTPISTVTGWAPQLQAIVDDAACLTGIGTDTILGWCRTGPVVDARFAVIWAARHEVGYSWPRLGRALNRDHCSIIRGFRAAERRRGADRDFRALSDQLRMLAASRREARS